MNSQQPNMAAEVAYAEGWNHFLKGDGDVSAECDEDEDDAGKKAEAESDGRNEYGAAIPHVITDIKEYEESKKRRVEDEINQTTPDQIPDSPKLKTRQQQEIYKTVFMNETANFYAHNGYKMTGAVKRKVQKQIALRILSGKIFINGIGKIQSRHSNVDSTPKKR